MQRLAYSERCVRDTSSMYISHAIGILKLLELTEDVSLQVTKA
jgi:hypothetical protein